MNVTQVPQPNAEFQDYALRKARATKEPSVCQSSDKKVHPFYAAAFGVLRASVISGEVFCCESVA